jgi:hypothetical protein
MSRGLDFTKLYQALIARYNLEELRTLCAQLSSTRVAMFSLQFCPYLDHPILTLSGYNRR